MRLEPLQGMQQLPRIQGLKQKETKRAYQYLSNVEMILYSTNLCYYTHKILNNEIKVKNRDVVINNVMNEVYRMNNLLKKDDWYSLENVLSVSDKKANFKKFGITDKKLEYKC